MNQLAVGAKCNLLRGAGLIAFLLIFGCVPDQTSQLRVELSRQYLENNDLESIERAVAELKLAAKNDRRNPSIHSDLANACWQLFERKQASGSVDTHALSCAQTGYRQALSLSSPGAADDFIADAHEGLGRALYAGANGDPAAIQSAIDHYVVAYQYKRSYARAEALAHAHGALNEHREAVSYCEQMVDLATGSNEHVNAYLLLAEQRLALGGQGRFADAEYALQQAVSAAPARSDDWVKAQYKLGQARFDHARHASSRAKLSEAESAFRAVIEASPGSSPGPFTAEAFYRLSLINAAEFQDNAHLDHAVYYAEAAVRADGGRPEYRRQACVASILRGGESVRSDANLGWCTATQSAEDHLFRGMFHLRQAQSIPNNHLDPISGLERYLSVLAAAQAEFEAGLSQTALDAGRQIQIEWPVWDYSGDLHGLLTYGAYDVVARCGRQGVRPMDAAVVDSGEVFFGRFNVRECG